MCGDRSCCRLLINRPYRFTTDGCVVLLILVVLVFQRTCQKFVLRHHDLLAHPMPQPSNVRPGFLRGSQRGQTMMEYWTVWKEKNELGRFLQRGCQVCDVRDKRQFIVTHSWDISFFTRAHTDVDSGCVSYNSVVLSPSCKGLQYDHEALRLAVS